MHVSQLSEADRVAYWAGRRLAEALGYTGEALDRMATSLAFGRRGPVPVSQAAAIEDLARDLYRRQGLSEAQLERHVEGFLRGRGDGANLREVAAPSRPAGSGPAAEGLPSLPVARTQAVDALTKEGVSYQNACDRIDARIRHGWDVVRLLEFARAMNPGGGS